MSGSAPGRVFRCVGIGPTKTLAKLANHIAKKHPRSLGVFNYNALSSAQQDRLLGQIAVSEVWGVGRRLTAQLQAHGIETVQDLRIAHTATLRSAFGVLMEKTQRELQGTACMDLQEAPSAKKQIIASRSFGQPVQELPLLQDAISNFVAIACAKLRAQNSQAALIQVFVHTNRFRQDQPQYSPCLAVPLPQATSDSLVVNHWAAALVERMYRPDYRYKKAGVMLSDISPAGIEQTDWLEPLAPTQTPLMNALDQLNQRYGRGTVKISGQGAYSGWQMKQERKSPHYTTDWEGLPCV